MEFPFPDNILKTEDYSPVQVLILKDYYQNNFNDIIDKVNHKQFILTIF